MTRKELTRILLLYAKDIKGSDAQKMARMLLAIHSLCDLHKGSTKPSDACDMYYQLEQILGRVE